MTSNPEVVCDGIVFGEGPVWRASDGALVVTSVPAGLLWQIDVATGDKSVLADVDGGANGAALASDGGFLVTQNGGVDVTGYGIIAEPIPYREATPGLQRVHPDGTVSYLAAEGFHAPNDLAVAADGTVYFTDPGHYPPPDPYIGRVLAFADGAVRTVASDFRFCNGIAFTPAGDLIVIESLGLMRVATDGSGARDWVIERVGKGGGDGFCLDADGRYYVAATIEHGVKVIDADGAIAEFLPIPGDGVVTNCCFGGNDLRTLFVTDALAGTVVAWEQMPTPGLPLPIWPVS